MQAKQANLKLILTSALAFIFIGSPIAQAQDQTLAQTLETLVVSLEQWQTVRSKASEETKNAFLLQRETFLKDVQERKEEIARLEENEKKARQQLGGLAFGECQIFIEARRAVRDQRSSLVSDKNNLYNQERQFREYTEEVEKEIKALTQELTNVLTQLATMLGQNKQ